MRWFFPAEIKTIADDGEATMRNLQGHIIELVNNEDKSNPLSDGDMADILAERGFDIARRTMAKYREQLGIPSSRKRKKQ
jgi:RNA polymerase sigma-54 factor